MRCCAAADASRNQNSGPDRKGAGGGEQACRQHDRDGPSHEPMRGVAILRFRTHYAVPHLKQAGAGAIVIVSSINGTRSFSDPGSTAYSCSKAAQFAMALMAARELAKHRIRVNVICPGSITTNIDDNT